MTHRIRPLFSAATLALLAASSACETNQGTGTAVGAGGGAALGAIMGNNVDGISKTEGAIAGAVVGGLMGNVMGRQQDQINAARAEAAAANQAANTTVVNVTNSNGSVTPVVLTRTGTGWQGPRGEIYPSIPSQSQLRPVYGF